MLSISSQNELCPASPTTFPFHRLFYSRSLSLSFPLCFQCFKMLNCWIQLSICIALIKTEFGRAIAQAVSRWLPTAAARVRARVWSSGICGGQSGARAGFLRVLRFPLPIFIPPIAPQSPCTIGLYNRPEVAAVPGDVSPTPQKKPNLLPSPLS
jgi:hypothetical protein